MGRVTEQDMRHDEGTVPLTGLKLNDFVDH